MTEGPARLAVEDLTKSYGGSTALDRCTFQVGPGEVVALVGHNGAGKSTVSKVVSGYERPDAGTVRVDGGTAHLRSPQDALNAGIGLVPQQLAVVPTMSVAQNLVLGLRTTPAGLDEVAALLDLDGVMNLRVERLGPAAQRLVMIGRTLLRDPRLLILDEPTAAFSARETERLFGILGDLTSRDISIIYVSHRLEEILQIADRVVGLSQGRVIADRGTTGLTRDDLADVIAGGEEARAVPEELRPGPTAAPRDTGSALLELRDVRTSAKRGAATLSVHSGEVVGVTGLVGAGRSTLLNAVWGTGERLVGGSVCLGGSGFSPSSPREAMRRGMVLIPEGRQRTSLIPRMNVHENGVLPTSRARRHRGTPFPNRRRERDELETVLADLDTKPHGAIRMPIEQLSGGNQQKVVLARWLLSPADVIMLDEPCEGVDVRARQEIHALLRRLADAGKAVVVSSSDVEELVESADRILVMRDGEIVAELAGADKTVERVNRACL